MTIDYNGPFIRIAFKANELPSGPRIVELAPGYTYERIFIHDLQNISALNPYQRVERGDRITFPPVNSKSPSPVHLFVPDGTKEAKISFSIEKFGQIPNPNYFSYRPFASISVTGDDDNEYDVIPSDQFK